MTDFVKLALVVLAACRGGGAETPDGPSDDASADAGPDADPDSGVAGQCAEDLDGVGIAPAGYVEAIVHDAAGIATCRLDLGSTLAHVAVPAGGALTLITTVREPEYVSLLGLEPGDMVDPRLPTLSGEFPIEVAFAEVPGATSYRLTCANQASATSPLSAVVSDRCRGGDGMLHMLLTARSATNEVIAFTEIGPFAAVPAAVTAGAFQTAFASSTITVTNTPVDLATSVRSCGGIVLGGVPVFAICGASGSAVANVSLPAIGEAIFVETVFAAAESGTWVASRQVPPGTAAITIDADTDALPRVTTTTPSGALGRPQLAWTTSRPVTDGVELVAGVDWEVNNTRKQWYVVAPISTPSPIVFPQLPADLVPGVVEEASLFLFENDLIDYARVRTHPFEVWRLPLRLPVGDYPGRWGISVLGDYDPI